MIKDGYFAAWVTGREARGDNWDLTQRSSSAADAVVEIVGVPATSGGVVRIQAREVALSTDFVVGGALGQPRDAGPAGRLAAGELRLADPRRARFAGAGR